MLSSDPREGLGMQWLTDDWQLLGSVAAKAVLMYVVALFGLRVSLRRSLLGLLVRFSGVEVY